MKCFLFRTLFSYLMGRKPHFLLIVLLMYMFPVIKEGYMLLSLNYCIYLICTTWFQPFQLLIGAITMVTTPLTISRRVTHYFVVEDLKLLKHLYACSTEETFLEDFLLILKSPTQNCWNILKKYFLVS